MASLAKISYFLTPSPLQLCIYHCSPIVTSSAHCKTNHCPGDIKGRAGPEETAVKLIFLGEGDVKLGHPSNFVFFFKINTSQFNIFHLIEAQIPKTSPLLNLGTCKSMRVPRAPELRLAIVSHRKKHKNFALKLPPSSPQ